ncbi:MAG: hypothetical protein LH654_02070 [Thermoleophilia bacterium]|nr:hypothetical protein [Thermoleophilia bacterium]
MRFRVLEDDVLTHISDLNTSVEAFEEYGYVALPGLLTAAEAWESYDAFDGFAGAHVDTSQRNFYTERVLTTHWGFVEAITKPPLIDALRQSSVMTCRSSPTTGLKRRRTKDLHTPGTSKFTVASRPTRASAPTRESTFRM